MLKTVKPRGFLKRQLSKLLKRKTPSTPSSLDQQQQPSLLKKKESSPILKETHIAINDSKDQSLKQQQESSLNDYSLFSLSHRALRVILSSVLLEKQDHTQVKEVIERVNDLLFIVSHYSQTQKLVLFNDIHILQNAYGSVNDCVKEQNVLEEKEGRLKLAVIDLEVVENDPTKTHDRLSSSLSELSKQLQEYIAQYTRYLDKVEAEFAKEVDRLFTSNQQKAMEVVIFGNYRPSALILFIKYSLSGLSLSEQLELYNVLQQLVSDQQDVSDTFRSLAKDVLKDEYYQELITKLHQVDKQQTECN